MENDLTCMQSNKDIFKALKFKILDELMPHIRIFVNKNKIFVSTKMI